MRDPTKSRPLIRQLKDAGFAQVRGRKHLRFEHPAGATVTIARTPNGSGLRQDQYKVGKAIRSVQQIGAAG